MTIEDVREDLRAALRSGYNAGHGSHGGGTAPQGLDELGQARWDGERLGHAVTRLISADLADYAADSRNYAEVADELNERYGAGTVVTKSEVGPGVMPGFRYRARVVQEVGDED